MRDDEFFEGIINGLARAEKEIYDLDTCEYEVSKKKQKEIKQSKKKKRKKKRSTASDICETIANHLTYE